MLELRELGGIEDMAAKVQIPKEMLDDFCRRRQIRKLSLFGSVLRSDFGPQSDVDVLVEFEPGTPVGYFELADMEAELSRLLGRKADIRTPAELSRYFRDDVVAAAETQYVSG
jgi:predicted nucleotidyltransferase